MFCEENSFSPQNYKKKVNYTNFSKKKCIKYALNIKNVLFFVKINLKFGVIGRFFVPLQFKCC